MGRRVKGVRYDGQRGTNLVSLRGTGTTTRRTTRSEFRGCSFTRRGKSQIRNYIVILTSIRLTTVSLYGFLSFLAMGCAVAEQGYKTYIM